MDTFSYLLGKKSGGGGGGSDLDWSAIGFNKTPQSIIDGYDLAVKIQNEWGSSSTLSNYSDVLFVPLVDVSNRTSFSYFASNCYRLIDVALLDTSNATNLGNMFSGCYALESVPQFNTSKATTMGGMFQNCYNLKNVPQFNTSNVTFFGNMFISCTKLSDESLNNILAMCINATSYTGTKTLAILGITNRTLKNKVPTLSNYQAFLDAGWTIE